MCFRFDFPFNTIYILYILSILSLNTLFSIETNAEKCSYYRDSNPLKIKNLLPDKYLSISPPNRPHPVYIGLEILDVNAINDAENYFSLHLHLFEVWSDFRLNTSLLDEGYISVTEDYSVCLWTPSIVFDGSTRLEQIFPPSSLVKIYENNVLIRKSRFSFKVSCHMNLQTYPLDRHVCHYTIRTFSDSMDKVNLKWIEDISSPIANSLDSVDNKSIIFNTEFTPSLFDIKIGEKSQYIKHWFGENYTVLDLEFIFVRTITSNILTVYIPSSLIVTLSWLQFWFDVEAVPGRMSLGIMSTLTIMTQILTNYEKAANHVTAVDIWLLVCLIMVFLALMEYAVAYTISHYHDIDGNLRAKNSFKKNLSLILCEFRANKIKSIHNMQKQNEENISNNLFKRVSEQLIYDKREISAEDNRIKSFPELVEIIHCLIKSYNELNKRLETTHKCNRHLNLVDYISRYVFPLLFVVFAFIYWILLIHFYDTS